MTLLVDGPEIDQLGVFYDPLSYAAYDHPYEVYRQLRDQAPVYYSARRDLWVISRHADVSACLRNHEQLVNALGNDMDGTHDSYGTGNLVAQDQPRHSVLRTVVRPSFAARRSWPWKITSAAAPASCWASSRRGVRVTSRQTSPFRWCSPPR